MKTRIFLIFEIQYILHFLMHLKMWPCFNLVYLFSSNQRYGQSSVRFCPEIRRERDRRLSHFGLRLHIRPDWGQKSCGQVVPQRWSGADLSVDTWAQRQTFLAATSGSLQFGVRSQYGRPIDQIQSSQYIEANHRSERQILLSCDVTFVARRGRINNDCLR